MPETIYGQIGAVFMVATCAFALLKGDEPERIGGSVFALIWFAGLVWKSRRAWPVWASAFQLLTVMGHIMNMTDLRPSIAAFYAVNNLAAYGIMACLAAGTFWAWQDRRAAGLE